MKRFHFGYGMILGKITCMDIAGFLRMSIDQGLCLYNLKYINQMSVLLDFSRKDMDLLLSILEKCGGSISILGRYGLWWHLLTLVRRPVLSIGIMLMLVLTFYLPTRVLFVRVSGNQSLPDNLILEKAAECGISFGASREDVRSEKMKNALLYEIPQLEWAGVNTYGCVAEISVEERAQKSFDSGDMGYTNMVASSDGIISQIIVNRGTPLVKVGQAVKNGQILISTYSDCGRFIRVSEAEGEVYARTIRETELILPPKIQKADRSNRVINVNKIKIGKNIINLSKDSGIYNGICDKMYKETYLTLPGGLRLPISWISEQYIFRDVGDELIHNDHIKQQMQNVSDAYVLNQMIAGQFIHSQSTFEKMDGGVYLYTRYSCNEMIGIPKNEEFEVQ